MGITPLKPGMRINLPENLESPIRTGSYPEPENLESPIRIGSYPEPENLESPIRIGSYLESATHIESAALKRGLPHSEPVHSNGFHNRGMTPHQGTASETANHT
jgi:hypothetical protein